jgi:hypothetical protein
MDKFAIEEKGRLKLGHRLESLNLIEEEYENHTGLKHQIRRKPLIKTKTVRVMLARLERQKC